MASERLNYIDVAKGLLILCVVFGHIYGHSKSIDNITVDYFHRISNLYISFYMPCFFLITGYCSNFNKKLNTLFTSSFKTIAFPGIIFSIFFFLLERKYDVASFCHLIKGISFYGGSYWFLSALFVARILYGLIYKWVGGCRMYYVCILSFVLGFILSTLPHKYEFWWFYHAVILMPYLGLGQYLKKKEYCFDDLGIICPIYILLYMTTIVLAHYGILKIDYFYHCPGITQMFINVNLSMLLSLIVLSIFGSVLTITISKLIYKNTLLEFFGKNSLIIYCVHGFVLNKLFSLIGAVITSETAIITAIILFVAGFIFTMLIVSGIVYIINQKYLRILIGKF